MKINNIVGNFDLHKPFHIDVAFDILSVVKESQIFVLKLKNEISVKNNCDSKISEKKAFNNCLQVNFVNNISFKFFKNGRIHVSGFKNTSEAYLKLDFILDLLKKNTPLEPKKIKAYENKSGILFYTNSNKTTYILGKRKNQNVSENEGVYNNIYIHKVRVFFCPQKYKTGRKKDKEIQLELCEPIDDVKQIVYDGEKNLFYSSTHLRERIIFDNHINFIGKSTLTFISAYRRNLPRHDKFYIEDDKLYFISDYTNPNSLIQQNLPFALLVEKYYENVQEPHLEDKYLEFPSFDYNFDLITFEIDLINVKASIGDGIESIDKTMFYHAFSNYSDVIEVKYNPNNYSGICFEYLPFKIKGQIHGNSVNLHCEKIDQAKIVVEFLKTFYQKFYNHFTQRQQETLDLNLDMFQLLAKI